MSGPLDLGSIPSDQRCAYYELLFAMAAADGGFTAEELGTIHRSLDLSGFDPDQLDRMRRAIVRPPAFAAALRGVADASVELRHGVLVGLYDAAIADGALGDAESRALEQAADVLGIDRDKLAPLGDLLGCLHEIKRRDAADEDQLDRLKVAAESVAARGFPVSAAYFAGSVQELAARGQSGPLQTLGLGLGVVPGIGVAIYLGSTVRVSVSDLLTLSPSKIEQRVPTAASLARSREALEHLQQLAHRTSEDIRRQREQPDPDGEPIEVLEERLAGLRQLLITRRSALEDLG